MTSTTAIGLSAEQQAAVSSDAAAIVVVASAGSGKTEVVARRTERLLLESPGQSFRVLALSYTLKAADELSDRFRERLGDLGRRVDTNTVHGFAHGLLRRYGTRIGLPVEPEVLTRDEDRVELLARWLDEERRDVPRDLDRVLLEIDTARARRKPAPLLDEWQAALDASGAVDYASMLDRAIELLRLPTARRLLARLYGHVIVDEAQNLTRAQYELLTALIGGSDANHVPTMLVGDEKQSIVTFAGADPELIARFENEYSARRFMLSENFRSAERIVAVGTAIASRMNGVSPSPHRSAQRYAAIGEVRLLEAADERAEGELISTWVTRLLSEGLPESALAPSETSAVQPEEIAVLGRTAPSLRATRAALERAGHRPALASSPGDWLSTTAGKVAFELIALRSAADHQSVHWALARLVGAEEGRVRRPEDVQAVLSAHPDPTLRPLSALCALDDPESFVTRLGRLLLPESDTALSLADWEADVRQLREAWDRFVAVTDRKEQTWGNFRIFVARIQRGDELAGGVRLLTIHKAQGREFRAVAVVGVNDGQIPDFRADSPEALAAEMRTFYVAVTRPARVLLLSRACLRATRFGNRRTAESRFLGWVREAGVALTAG